MMENVEIWPGDLFSTKGSGITGWLNKTFTCTEKKRSHTDRFHFGVIADPILKEDGQFDDFETRESISKGPSTLRFFKRYVGEDIELYRLTGITKEEGVRLVRSISKIGEKGYGFKDFIQAALDVLFLMCGLQFPPYSAKQFAVSENEAYICTELCAYGAREIHHPIEPSAFPDLWVIPVLYLQAIEEGRLVRYYKGDLKVPYYQYRNGIG